MCYLFGRAQELKAPYLDSEPLKAALVGRAGAWHQAVPRLQPSAGRFPCSIASLSGALLGVSKTRVNALKPGGHLLEFIVRAPARSRAAECGASLLLRRPKRSATASARKTACRRT